MSTVLTLTLPDGNQIVVKARGEALDEEVPVKWSGPIERLGTLVHDKHTIGFLQWFLESRAQHLQGKLEIRTEQD